MSDAAKGQLISKCLYEIIVWTKIPTKILIISALKGQGRNYQNFWWCLWSKRWLHKDILKLTDLYQEFQRKLQEFFHEFHKKFHRNFQQNSSVNSYKNRSYLKGSYQLFRSEVHQDPDSEETSWKNTINPKHTFWILRILLDSQ